MSNKQTPSPAQAAMLRRLADGLSPYDGATPRQNSGRSNTLWSMSGPGWVLPWPRYTLTDAGREALAKYEERRAAREGGR